MITRPTSPLSICNRLSSTCDAVLSSVLSLKPANQLAGCGASRNRRRVGKRPSRVAIHAPPSEAVWGFTFLEILIATAIIATIGVALVSAQTAAVRASQTAREINELAYEVRRVVTRTHLGFGPERLETLESTRWSFSEEPSVETEGAKATFWHHWRIARAATGSPSIEIVLRARPNSER